MPNALFVLVIVYPVLLPFFEGCESATGLFLIHTLTLAIGVYCLLRAQRIWFPPLLSFLPFLLYLLVSCGIAPYKYSALLTLWDWWIAAIVAVCWTTIFKEHESEMKRLSYVFFIAGTCALILSVIAGRNWNAPRWHGLFANPNDFGAYAALFLVIGIFHLERVVTRTEKIIVWMGMAFLAVCMALAASRSVFLAMTVVIAAYLLQRKPARWVLASLMAFLILSAGLLSFRLLHQDPLQYYRLKIWKYSLQGILKDPYLGIGLNMLPWKAAQFNFPADVEIGRFGKIATSADNQYLQILAETGFVGFFLYLFGWLGIYFLLRQIPARFGILRYSSFLLLSIICLFSLPIENTAILFLFLFTLLFPVCASEIPLKCFTLKLPIRIFGSALLIAAFIFAVLIPFSADFEFKAAQGSTSPELAYMRFHRAVGLNPYQPYYRLALIRPYVLTSAALTEEKWLKLIDQLQRCTDLNPLDATFPIYDAKIFRILHQQTGKEIYLKQSIESYQHAVELSPYQVFQRAELAYYLYSQGRYEHAEEELNTILILEPAFLNARLLRAEIKLRKGELDSAKNELKELDQMAKRFEYERKHPLTPYIGRLLELNTDQENTLKQSIP